MSAFDLLRQNDLLDNNQSPSQKAGDSVSAFNLLNQSGLVDQSFLLQNNQQSSNTVYQSPQPQQQTENKSFFSKAKNFVSSVFKKKEQDRNIPTLFKNVVIDKPVIVRNVETTITYGDEKPVNINKYANTALDIALQSRVNTINDQLISGSIKKGRVVDNVVKEKEYLTSLLNGDVSSLRYQKKNLSEDQYREFILQQKKEALKNIKIQEITREPANIIEDVSRQLASGFTSSANTLVKFTELISDKIGLNQLSKKISKQTDEIDKLAEQIAVQDPNFADAITQGVGSSAPFVIGSVLLEGAAVDAGVSSGVAKIGAIAFDAFGEATSESGSVYHNLIKSGEAIPSAYKKAMYDFWGNVVLNVVTDRLGAFSSETNRLKKVVMSGLSGSFEEVVQQGMSNLAEGKPIDEGMLESGLIGEILGSGAGSLSVISEYTIPDGIARKVSEETNQTKQLMKLENPKSTLLENGNTDIKDQAGLDKLPDVIKKEFLTTRNEKSVDNPSVSFVDPKVYAKSIDNAVVGKMMNTSDIKMPDYAKSKDSIKRLEVGIVKEQIAGGDKVNPIILDGKGNVLDGAHRLTAMKELGVKKVATIIQKGKTENKIKNVNDKVKKVENAKLQDIKMVTGKNTKQTKTKESEKQQQGKNTKPIKETSKDFRDIPESTIARAYNWSSFDPEKTAKYKAQEYADSMKQDYENTKKMARTADEKIIIEKWFDKYRETSKSMYLSYLSSEARTASSAVTGAANFNVSRNRRRMEIANSKMNALVDYQNRELKKIKDTLNPSKISSRDKSAKEKLQKKIDSHKKLLEQMKAVNKVLRKGGGKKELLEIIPNFSEESIKELLHPSFGTKKGFGGYQLSSVRNKIKAAEQRISKLDKFDEMSKKGNEEVIFDGGKTVTDYRARMIKISFDEKPSQEMISKLKSGGFRWNRYNKVWQRLISSNAFYAYKKLGLGQIEARRVVDHANEFKEVFNQNKDNEKSFIDNINKFTRDKIKKVSDDNGINRLKQIKSEIKSTMINIVSSTGNWRSDYILFQEHRNDPKFKARLDVMETAIDKIDSILDTIGSTINSNGAVGADVGGYARTNEYASGKETLPKMQLPELIRLVRGINKSTPTFKEFKNKLGAMRGTGDGSIKLNYKLMKDPEAMAKTLSHEIGHLIDFFTNKTLSGNIYNKLLVVSKMKDDIVGKEDSIKNKQIRDELKTLTQIWKPFDDTENKTFTKYRYSSNELYADAISVMFNDPALLKKTSPTFWSTFFDNLNKKPVAEKNLLELWNVLNKSDEEIFNARNKRMEESFDTAEKKFVAKELDKQVRENSLVDTLRTLFDDRAYVIKKKFDKLSKQGKLQRGSPINALHALNYIDGKIRNFVRDNFEVVFKQASKVTNGWSQLGKILFLERTIHERGATTNPIGLLKEIKPELYEGLKESLPKGVTVEMIEEKDATTQYEIMKKALNKWKDNKGHKLGDDIIAELPHAIANPQGYTIETAKAQLEGLKSSLTIDEWNTLQSALKLFRSGVDVSVDNASKHSFYTPEMLKQMKANKHYSTYQVIDYLDTYISPVAYKSVGTLKDIANPATSTVMKLISVQKAIERNNAKKLTIDAFKLHFPEDIQEANTKWNGKTMMSTKPKDPKLSLVTVIYDGKPKGFYISKSAAEALNGASNETIKAFAYITRKITIPGVYRTLFTSFNMGFQTFNLVRDFNRTWRNAPDANFGQILTSLPRLIGAYIKNVPAAWSRAINKPNDLIKEMENKKILGLTFTDMYNLNVDDYQQQVERVFQKTGVLRKEQKKNILAPITKVLEGIDTIGDFLETLPKVAAYDYYLDKSKFKNREQFNEFIRTSMGSPDFRIGGSATSISNSVFLFSNAIKEGIKTDVQIAKTKGRMDWWVKLAMTELVPKLIMAGMLKGFLGDELKKLMNGVTEYDMANYKIIPIGFDKGGKVKYLRIPTDETGRFFGSIFYKMISLDKSITEKDFQDIFSFGAGQLPNLSPAFKGIGTLVDYLSGNNPWDSFRNRNIIPEKAFNAGMKESLPYVIDWLVKNQGMGIILPQTRYGNESNLQKMIGLPVINNIVGRWIKVTNYGETEKLKKLTAKSKQNRAKELIKKDNLLQSAIKNYTKHPGKATEIKRQLVTKMYGEKITKDNKRKAKALIKSFNIGVLKKKSDPKINAVIYANTNDEKIILLNDYKQSIDRASYIDILKTLYKNKVISENVINKVR